MVMYGLLIVRVEVNVMLPATRNTTVRGPEASVQLRKLPAPLLFRFVTSQTEPPLPPTALAPSPSAPGKATMAWSAGVIAMAIKIRRVIASPPSHNEHCTYTKQQSTRAVEKDTVLVKTS